MLKNYKVLIPRPPVPSCDLDRAIIGGPSTAISILLKTRRLISNYATLIRHLSLVIGRYVSGDVDNHDGH